MSSWLCVITFFYTSFHCSMDLRNLCDSLEPSLFAKNIKFFIILILICLKSDVRNYEVENEIGSAPLSLSKTHS